ncbi:hypothetical protein RFI_29864 [Reticulomyxa filosa]|uniref:UspA domain-containing protein n=1 Tax=Reticulomyxa filosa TaxID=46433 RepID=X6M0Y6_RETFI|nr:hypothetical protein RFI_29864 [Reticulomyxa filosa]|eukprot:ETO07529.1 hypothetical protein RFI_29864 [Reticulomyxa filosa]
MSNPTENDGKQPVEAEDLYSIKISMNVKEVVKEVSAHKGRTIMIALDGTEYSEKAAKWVHDNLAKKEDFIVLVRNKFTYLFFSFKKKSIWEEAMVEKLFKELDAEIIHPEVDVTKSKHNMLQDTFERAKILRDHPNLHALLVEAGNRVNPKNIGEELTHLAKQMNVYTIVCGTRGLGSVKQALLGSVSSYLSQHAHCTVVVVK